MLLNAIDHLPSHSQFVAAVAGDEEHMTMLVEAKVKAGEIDAPPPAPSQATWTPEVAALAAVSDGIQNLTRVTIMAAQDKGKKAPSFTPYPRPDNAYEDAKQKLRWKKHHALADRLLGRNLTPEQRQEAEESSGGGSTPALRR